MNLLDMLQEYTTQIMDDSSLSGGQQKEKMIQVFDLCHFIETYKQSLKIVDYSHTINVIKDDGIRKGIYFCDLLYNTKYHFNRRLYNQYNLKRIAAQLKIKELWFVIVEESFTTDDLTASKEFVKNNNVDSLYDNIFYFNFSQATIKILK